MNEENELNKSQSAGLLLALANKIEGNPNARDAIAAGFRVIAAELLRDDGSQDLETGTDLVDTATGPGLEVV